MFINGMKVLILLSILAAYQALPVPEVGASAQYNTQDNVGNYAFGYNEDHTSGGSFRKESGDALGNKIGSYGLHVADGRARVVNYVADSAGFRADVHTNEPGVDPTQDSADVSVNKPVVVAPVPAYVAPVAVAHAPHTAFTFVHAPLFHAPFGVASVLAHSGHVLAHSGHVLW